MDTQTKERLIRAAMNEAEIAIQEGNSPFGAVISDSEGNIVEVAHSTTNTDVNPIAHAEIHLIRKAAKKLNTKDLSNYYLISNAQSCPMCFSAAIKSKISHFIYGYAENETLNPKIDVFQISKYCKQEVHIETGILKDECSAQIEQVRKMAK
ncbi:MAG: nucleoside deaminase [Candidatus Magasanikbacteria bacterium]